MDGRPPRVDPREVREARHNGGVHAHAPRLQGRVPQLTCRTCSSVPATPGSGRLDGLCKIIRMASEAGLRALLYNITILGHLRTGPRPGRGGARLPSFRYADLDHTLPEFEGGAADADTMWERIDHFLGRVAPVADEYRVQLACHPQDPGIEEPRVPGR